jgi:hypothetical protein
MTTDTKPVLEDWDQARWLKVLDRIDHRQEGIGLRFCGPPLWLEVTMSGPDSDDWAIAATGQLPDRSWDWQSTMDCAEAMNLEATGADDESLLSAVSRYTLENLVLNAAHEIGEWLRFDAKRCFPSHGAPVQTPDRSLSGVGDGTQGNGCVSIQVDFDIAPPIGATPPSMERGVTPRLAHQIDELAAPWRFTYLPGKLISYDEWGPVVTDTTAVEGGGRAIVWWSNWSTPSAGPAEIPANELLAYVQRDVHRMLVHYETSRICQAFHVDGHQPWRLAPDQGRPSDGDSDNPGLRNEIALSIAYDQ